MNGGVHGGVDVDGDIDEHDIHMYHHTHYQLQAFNLHHHDTAHHSNNTDITVLERLPSSDLQPQAHPHSHAHPSAGPILLPLPLPVPTPNTTIDPSAFSATASRSTSTSTSAFAPTARSAYRSRVSSKRRGSTSAGSGPAAEGDISDDMTSSSSSVKRMGLSTPYDRREYRKLRHRETDSNRRIRIKNLLEELRTVIYPDESVKVEQSQIIQDALDYIEKLREDNRSYQQRVEQLEMQQQAPATHTITAATTTSSSSTEDPAMMNDLMTIYRVPEKMRNTNIAVWTTSIDGRWLDVNTVFEWTTAYKASELQNRYAAEYPGFLTSFLSEYDPYDSGCQNGNSTGTSLTVSSREVPLGLGCSLYTDSKVQKRASETPLLFNAYWVSGGNTRRATKFMAQVIRDERNLKPAYVLHMYYKCN